MSFLKEKLSKMSINDKWLLIQYANDLSFDDRFVLQSNLQNIFAEINEKYGHRMWYVCDYQSTPIMMAIKQYCRPYQIIDQFDTERFRSVRGNLFQYNYVLAQYMLGTIAGLDYEGPNSIFFKLLKRTSLDYKSVSMVQVYEFIGSAYYNSRSINTKNNDKVSELVILYLIQYRILSLLELNRIYVKYQLPNSEYGAVESVHPGLKLILDFIHDPSVHLMDLIRNDLEKRYPLENGTPNITYSGMIGFLSFWYSYTKWRIENTVKISMDSIIPMLTNIDDIGVVHNSTKTVLDTDKFVTMGNLDMEPHKPYIKDILEYEFAESEKCLDISPQMKFALFSEFSDMKFSNIITEDGKERLIIGEGDDIYLAYVVNESVEAISIYDLLDNKPVKRYIRYEDLDTESAYDIVSSEE